MGRVSAAVNFAQVLSGSAEPLNTPEEALTLMKITDAIYKSAETKRPVEL
jgi:predicted dehydrogenase